MHQFLPSDGDAMAVRVAERITGADPDPAGACAAAA